MLTAHLRDGPCQVRIAPLDVKLSDEDAVHPDVRVYCDHGQNRQTHLAGAPRLVVAVLSPSSEVHGRIYRMRLYAKYRVAEYWIVNPWKRIIEVHTLDGDSYQLHCAFAREETITSPALPGLGLPLAAVFGVLGPPGAALAARRPACSAYFRLPCRRFRCIWANCTTGMSVTTRL